MAARVYGIPPTGFRLPDETRVGAVHLQVSDLSRALDYYERVLGLRAYEKSSERAILGPHGEHRSLVSLQTRPGVTSVRRGAFGLFHFAILLPDRGALGRFAAHLSTIDVRVGMADHLVSEALYLWDPDGLGIEVYADRPRNAWQHRDREVVMTTDPLDVDDVIAAGAGQPWQGIPAGTTMGHVHLHVGSLAEAEAYYHSALGFEKTNWTYPGALFLAAGGYHHHLGTNVWAPGPRAGAHEARLVEWELAVPRAEDAAAAAQSLRAAGYDANAIGKDCVAVDPWGTQLRVVSF
jgi:catechol 2,3-dioxygenase